MLKTFSKNFKKLPDSNKSMVYLTWIYWVWSFIAGMFINIYVFKLHNSIYDTVYYNIIFLTSTLLWFSLIWYLMWILKKDIKNMYYISYVLFMLSFIELFVLKSTLTWTYIFWVLYGLWNGTFWNALHTQELKNIESENRYFYSSCLSAWKNIISIVLPLFVSMIFYLWNKLNFDWYFVLFMFLPFVYAISFLFIKNISSYIPNSINKHDLKNFFNMKKYKFWHLYFFMSWLIMSLFIMIVPIINIILLKNEINIWLYQWFLTILSTYVLVHFSIKRTWKNKFKYFLIFSILLWLNSIFLWFYFSLTNFIIYSLIWLFLNPMFRVSEHVYDLALMDNIKTDTADFYPAMILREIILWIWRITSLLLLLFIFKYFDLSTNSILKLTLVFLWILFIIIPWSIYLWEKNEKHL